MHGTAFLWTFKSCITVGTGHIPHAAVCSPCNNVSFLPRGLSDHEEASDGLSPRAVVGAWHNDQFQSSACQPQPPQSRPPWITGPRLSLVCPDQHRTSVLPHGPPRLTDLSEALSPASAFRPSISVPGSVLAPAPSTNHLQCPQCVRHRPDNVRCPPDVPGSAPAAVYAAPRIRWVWNITLTS